MDQHIQLFYLKTGNGHLAPAKAIAKNLSREHDGKVSTQLVDGLSGARQFIRSMIEDGYRQSVNNATWVFEGLYALHKIHLVAVLTATIVSIFTKRSLERQILEGKPTKLVILHFFLIKPIMEILAKHNLNIPVITVVTDPFTAHPIWFLNKNPKFVVFSEQLKQSAIKAGISSDNLTVYPFILDEQYDNRYTHLQKLEAKESLGFDIGKKLILIIGGGEGIPKGAAIAEQIRLLKSDAEVAFVCGRNAKLQQKVERVKEKYHLTNLKVYGFVDYVHLLLNISDIVVTKCGASTFMEILMAQKIPVISNYIWEQEKGNMEYVRDNKMGVYENRVHKLPMLLDQLVSNHQLHSRFVQNIHMQNIRSGTKEVSNYILQMQA